MAKHHGGCLCGRVRYGFEGEAVLAGSCYCRDCQKYTGLGHGSGMAVPTESFELTGDPAVYETVGDGGGSASRYFCPVCGSHLLSRASRMAGLTTIYPGTLDDPSIFEPRIAVYTARAQSWDQPPSGIPQHAEAPIKPVLPR